MSQNDTQVLPSLKINKYEKCLAATFAFQMFSIGTYSLFEGAMLGSNIQLDLEDARKLRDFLTEWLEKCDE